MGLPPSNDPQGVHVPVGGRRAQASRSRVIAPRPPQRPYPASAWSSTRTHERPPDHLEDRQRSTRARLAFLPTRPGSIEWYMGAPGWSGQEGPPEASGTERHSHVPGLGCHATCESKDEVLVGSNGRWVVGTHKCIALRAVCAFSMLISPADPRAALARSRATSSSFCGLRRKSQTTTKQATLHINTLLCLSERKTNIPVTDTYIMFVVRCGL